MQEQKVHSGLGLSIPPEEDVEDGDVCDGGDEEEGAVAADRNHVCRVEAHVTRELWWEENRKFYAMRINLYLPDTVNQFGSVNTTTD